MTEINIRNPGIGNRTTQFLTGLPNAAGYLKIVEDLRKKKVLNEYSAFCFNLRGFGDVSRMYGQKEGDRIIKEYAIALENFLEPGEWAGHLGEDSFTALVKKTHRDSFIDFLAGVSVNVHAGDRKERVRIDAAAGVWDITGTVEDSREVIRRPSIALSHARHVLHQSVSFATDEMVSSQSRSKNVLVGFRDALEHEEFYVYYQPKVDSRTGLLVGAEGLVRWKHNGEIVSPGIFIPPLEQSGEIRLLDYFVLQKTCTDILRWQAQGLEPVTVSVNFSRMDLEDPQLAENINNIIEECGVDKRLIEVEVTETVDTEEHGSLTEFIQKLYDMGIRTAIDDFGSGYSSLSTLREFAAHTLKIDRSFINTDDFSWKDEVILTGIVRIAEKLSMNVLIEGVEREDQLVFANNAGCYVIQGFYYDRPLPVEDFEKRLANKQYGK